MANKMLRHLIDFELEAAGWSTGDIRLVRRVLDKGAKTPTERRVAQRYQQLRRDIVAKEELAAAKAEKRAARYETEVYAPGHLHEIPDPVAREKALAIEALWAHSDGGVVPFGGIFRGIDKHNPEKADNYYLHAGTWNHTMPRMHASAGRLTQDGEKIRGEKPAPGAYKYATVTVRTAYSRIRNGKDLFAWETV